MIPARLMVAGEPPYWVKAMHEKYL